MYLSKLNPDEKHSFLEIAYTIATIDGENSYEEQAVIESYCAEMNINNEIYGIDLSDAILSFKEHSDASVQRIIVFEAIGLAMADSNFDSAERTIIKKMTDAFGLSDEFISESKAVISELLEIQDRANKLILDV